MEQAFSTLPDLSYYVNSIDPRAHATVLITGHMPVRQFVYDQNGMPLEDMSLQVTMEWRDGEWTAYRVKEEALTAQMDGAPTKVLQCEPVVMGTIGHKVCWAKPVLNGIGVLLTWSLKYRSTCELGKHDPSRQCDTTSFSPYTARVRDPVSHVVMRVLQALRAWPGPEGTWYARWNREWTFQESAREELEVLFEERYSTRSANRAAARAERLIHDFLFNKEGLDPIKELPGIIRSVEHLSLYLEGAEGDDMPASEALGLFIHAHFEDVRGDQGLRFVLNQVIDVQDVEDAMIYISSHCNNMYSCDAFDDLQVDYQIFLYLFRRILSENIFNSATLRRSSDLIMLSAARQDTDIDARQLWNSTRLDPPGCLVAEYPSEPSIVRGLAVDLNGGLRDHCALFSTNVSTVGNDLACAHRALTALGVTDDMAFDEMAEYLWRNEAGHDAHRYTMAERCGQHANGKQGDPYSPGQLRKGLAVARDYFLEFEADELEWTQGNSGPPHVMPQAMNEALQDKFERFLREYDGGPLEPGFAEVANWALAAFGFDENEDGEDDIKSFLVKQQQELAEETHDDEQRGYWTSDVAMRKALQLLRECLRQDD